MRNGKTGRRPSEKTLVNLQHGAKKHSRNKRPLTRPERLFCFFYEDTGSAHKAAELAGLHPKTGYYLLKQPHIQAFRPTAAAKMLDEAVKYVSKKTHIAVELLDRELIKAIKQKNGHVKNEALEIGYQRVGVLERKGSTNVSATANAAAAAQAGSTMKQIYKSKWLQDTESQIEKELISERDRPLLPGNTETPAE